MGQTSKTFTLLHLTDSHLMPHADSTLLGVNTADYFLKILDKSVSEQQPVDLILLTGDLAQDPSAQSYQFLLDNLLPLKIPCLCLPGNHDDFAIMQAILCTDIIHCRKQVILGTWQVIALNSQIPDSPAGRLADSELAFLQQCFQAYPNHHSLVAVHHHCLPTHSAWMDTMIIANHEAFLETISHYKQAKLIVNGHIHQEMDRMSGSTRVLATPSTCFQFAPASQTFQVDRTAPAYRVIKLFSDGSATTEVRRLSERPKGLLTNHHGY